MNKKLITSGVVIVGVGVAGYFILRKPKWEVLKIEKVDDGVNYEFKVGKKIVTLKSTANTITEETVQFPLFGFTFTTSPTLKELDYPAVELKISKRIGGNAPRTILINKEGQVD